MTNGNTYHYHYDGLGSTRQLTDSLGAVTVSYMYDSFGNLIASSGSTTNAYGFTGQQQFGEADNLVFLRARCYKPTIGRFLSPDPIGYEGGMNLYLYCVNDPVNSTDPSGLLKKIKPPRGLVSTSCMIAIAAACAVVCNDDYWDDPCDTWMDCMNKCMSTILDPRKSFGPGSDWRIRSVVIVCGSAIVIGF